MKSMKVAFITRIKTEDDLVKDGLTSIVSEADKSGIKDKHILLKTKNSVNVKHKINGIDVCLIHDDNPTAPTSINTALLEIRKKEFDAFLVASKEVVLKKENIERLIKGLQPSKMLVIGYKFTHKDAGLNNELSSYYCNEKLVAYRVPWNTCAIWRYKNFITYVKKFDEITSRNSFDEIGVTLDGYGYNTSHKGMEDGLAIAKARSKNNKLDYLLIDKKLEWAVNNKLDHRKKLARKDVVMRNFMALRNYSVKDLRSAEQPATETK